MSHELRTPLNGILGYAQILEHSPSLAEDSRNKVSIIHQCGAHLLTLINDILDISKIEARKLELCPEDTNLSSTIWGIAEIFKMRAKEKGITFNLNIDPFLPQIIVIDEKRLRQVLINLIGNAIKFTDQGTVDFNVTRQSDDRKNTAQSLDLLSTCTIQFTVKDTGVGMEPAQLEKIFLPFEQVGDHHHRAEGTGLGLAISQQILALMGSRLHVSSQPGQGSIFWTDLEFPVSQKEIRQSNVSTLQRVVGIQGQPPNILIIEDSQEDCHLMNSFLQSIGCITHTAINGLTGLAMAKQQTPDLILTDLVMHTVDGVTFLNALRNCPPLKDIPVIVVSASVFNEDKEKSLAAGATAFLPKPLDFSALLDLFQSQLDVKWIYTTCPSNVSLSSSSFWSDGPSLVPPDITTIRELYHLAMMGNLHEIEGKLSDMATGSKEADAFVQTMSHLVENFHVKQIKALLQSYLPSDESL